MAAERHNTHKCNSHAAICMSRLNAQLGFIEPQLSSSVDRPPQGDERIHETKHDGYRAVGSVLYLLEPVAVMGADAAQ